MKQAVLAGVVGCAFAAGIAVGLVLSGSNQNEGPAQTSLGTSGTEVATAPKVVLSPGETSGSSDQAAEREATSEPQAPGGPPDGPETPVTVEPPPPPPPPPSPEALAEAELIQRELEERKAKGNRGGGHVTTLIYPEDPEEARAWEERRKQSWERRLKREIDIKMEIMREKVGITAPQESELRKILDKEFQERSRLVQLLSSKQISNTSFDQGVRDNVAQAKQQLKNLLTPGQLEAYYALKPREQVLRDEIK